MANPLIPTPVVDKNGKSTTVHKKAGANTPAKGLNAPAPTLSTSSPAAQPRTPLTPPKPLTDEETREFENWHKETMQLFRKDFRYNGKAYRACLQPLDPETQALAWRIIQKGRVGDKEIIKTLNQHQTNNHMFRRTHYPVSLLHVKLQVMERMADQDPGVTDNAGGRLSTRVEQTVHGSYRRPKAEDCVPLTSIDSEEELNSLAAVATFLSHVSSTGQPSQYKEGSFKDSNGNEVNGIWMKNKLLDQHLRDNPSETPRIIEYMDKRGIGTTAKETRAALQHLKESEDLGVLDDGWI